MDLAARGAAAVESKDFALAVSLYTRALIGHPHSPDYFNQRSLAFARLSPPRHDLALKDAEFAVVLAQKRAKREKIQAAQQRRVVALHGLGRYADAKAVLQIMAKWRSSKPEKMEGDMWLARVEGKLKDAPESERLSSEKEYPEIDLPSEPQMKEWLKTQLKADGSYKFGQEEDVKTTTTDAAAATTGTTKPAGDGTTTGPSPSIAAPASAPFKIRHEWYQSPQAVTLTLYAKNVPREACDVDIQEDSVSVSFPHPSNPSSTFTFTLDPLFALIDPSQSRSAVLSTKIELTLRKAQAGKWHDLEGLAPLKAPASKASTEKDQENVGPISMSTLTNSSPSATTVTQPAIAKENPPSYPTSSRNGPKNWDKLANELHAQSKPKTKAKSKGKTKAKPDDASKDYQSSPDTSDVDEAGDYDSDFERGDPVDGFFKKLYASADEDTRRAMMKSFYESNGTALSTNWKEVGAKKVEEVKSSHD
ncbi:C domain-containing protein [Cladophialophora immunda]|nr:C domain-containing protein [Cladophialophora immunda]